MTPRKKKTPKPPEPYKEEVETFSRPSLSTGWCHIMRQPDAFNDWVYVRKYRITAELIDEPIEVIRARLVELWETCDNHHNRNPLQHEAAIYGLELPYDTFGIRRKTK